MRLPTTKGKAAQRPSKAAFQTRQDAPADFPTLLANLATIAALFVVELTSVTAVVTSMVWRAGHA